MAPSHCVVAPGHNNDRDTRARVHCNCAGNNVLRTAPSIYIYICFIRISRTNGALKICLDLLTGPQIIYDSIPPIYIECT